MYFNASTCQSHSELADVSTELTSMSLFGLEGDTEKGQEMQRHVHREQEGNTIYTVQLTRLVLCTIRSSLSGSYPQVCPGCALRQPHE